MSRGIVAALVIGTVIAVSAPAEALQCVPFAREVSGISIRGDAWTWWSAADGLYDRGQAPRVGAVVVFKKHGSMRHGHVAVVTQVINSREVLVDHANWGSRRTGGRGQIAKNMSVVDISAKNDWTEVRVWNRRSDDYGTRAYPTYGFIYSQGSHAARIQQASFIPTPPVATPHAAAVHVAEAPPVQRLSQPGDAVLATADQQIAAVLTDTATLPVKVEVKLLEVRVIEAKIETKAEPKVVESKAVEAKQEAKIVEARLETKPEPKIEPKIIEAKPVAKPAPVVAATVEADASSDSDLALAKRFGSGHY